jgi:hypothetical protein
LPEPGTGDVSVEAERFQSIAARFAGFQRSGSISMSTSRYCCPATIFRDILAALFGRLGAEWPHDGCGS